MATKGGKKSTKKVKTLATKNVSADKAKRVRGGINFTRGAKQSLASNASVRFK